ncbi:MAG TPA: ferritin [Gemmatimonadota bacterium]|nr:ferritin [Gemmatimonadota bacterium]
MNEKVREGLNAQIGRELQAEHLYLAMSIWFERKDLPGFAGWLRSQAAEEREHAFRILEHLEDRDARVELGGLEKPPADFDSPLAAMRAALEHERKVTGHIDDCYGLARKESDHPAEVMLQWFVDEQVEEEKTFGQIVGQLERIGDSGAGLLVMDRDLGARGG